MKADLGRFESQYRYVTGKPLEPSRIHRVDAGTAVRWQKMVDDQYVQRPPDPGDLVEGALEASERDRLGGDTTLLIHISLPIRDHRGVLDATARALPRHGFAEVWLTDDVDLYGLHPWQWQGYHKCPTTDSGTRTSS